MKFQQFLKMKGKVHESIDFKTINMLEGINLNDLDLDLDLSDLNVDEAIKNLNYSYEGNPMLNEDMAAIMQKIMSGVNYIRAKAMLPKYEEALLAADNNVIAERFSKKGEQINKKMEQLANNLKNLKTRQQKDQNMAQREALSKVLDKIEAGKDAFADKMATARDKIKADIDELTGTMVEPFKGLVSKEITAITAKVRQQGLVLKGETTMRDVKDPARLKSYETEKLEANKKYQEAMEKLESGEEASETELQELEGLDTIKSELMKYQTAYKDLKAQKVALKKIWDDADAANPEIDNSEDIKYEIQHDSEHSDLFEATTADSGKTPLEVFQAINGIPIKDENGKEDPEKIEEKKGLYTKLSALVEPYEKAVKALIAAKKAMWDKIQNDAPVTKEVLVIAGANAETTEADSDGNFKKKNAKLTDKWETAFNKPAEYGPLKDVTSVTYKYKDPAKPNDPAVERTGSLTDAITDKSKALPAAAKNAQQNTQHDNTEYDDLVSQNYSVYPGDSSKSATDNKAAAQAEKKPDGTPKYSSVEVKKKDGNDVVLVKEGLKFNSNSRIVPTFESYIHSRGLK